MQLAHACGRPVHHSRQNIIGSKDIVFQHCREAELLDGNEYVKRKRSNVRSPTKMQINEARRSWRIGDNQHGESIVAHGHLSVHLTSEGMS